MTLRVASLCSGVGMIDLAVQSVLPDAELAWYAQYEPPNKEGKPDRNQYAARIMAHHWPGVPNLGDITAIDYAQVEPVGLLTAGWPCTDLSLAGKQAGLYEGTRSGLWFHVARAIEALRPSLVLLENVRSLTSASAVCDLEFCPRCMGGPGGGGDAAVPDMRALGRVLGDLADLGFDAEWTCLTASAVGAPHKRERAFVLAWPAALGQAPGRGARADARGRYRTPAADPAHDGRERDRGAWVGRSGSAHDGVAASDAQGVGRGEGRTEPARIVGGPDAAERCGAAALDTASLGRRTEGQQHGLGTAQRGEGASADSDGGRRGPDESDDAERQPDAEGRGRFPWESTEYGPAIARWEAVLGRPAPWPVDDRGRLSPRLSEWMMGLPDGWVTGVPGIPRNAQSHAIGNGCVVQQGATALRMLLPAYWATVQGVDGFGLIRNGIHQQATTVLACGDAERAA